jgi:hypothetical protein
MIGWLSMLFLAAFISSGPTPVSEPGASAPDAGGIANVDVAFDVLPISLPLRIAGSDADVDEILDAVEEAEPDIDVDEPDEPDDVEIDEDGDGNVINGEFEGGSTEMGTSFVRESSGESTSGSRKAKEKDR